MEPFEEYIVVYRLGRIELYQEWVSVICSHLRILRRYLQAGESYPCQIKGLHEAVLYHPS